MNPFQRIKIIRTGEVIMALYRDNILAGGNVPGYMEINSHITFDGSDAPRFFREDEVEELKETV